MNAKKVKSAIKQKGEWNKLAFYGIFCLLLLISGCNSNPIRAESTNDLQSERTSSVAEPNEILVDSSNSTPSPIPVSTATFDEMPPLETLTEDPTSDVSTLTPIPTMTLTPLPTLTRDEAELLVMELYNNNGGCKLPCWWGVTPGVTTSMDAKRFLESFTIDAINFSETRVDNQITFFDIRLPAPPKLYKTYFLQRYGNLNGVVDSIYIREVFPSPRFKTIPNFLDSVGIPEEVWILASLGLFKDENVFEVMLFYPQHGILISFSGNPKQTGNRLNICPQELYPGNLFLWAGGKGKRFEDWRLKTRWGYYNDFYQPLEIAVGMDAQTFYETFKDPENTVCLQTSLAIWPTPGAVVEEWPTPTSNFP